MLRFRLRIPSFLRNCRIKTIRMARRYFRLRIN